MKGWRLFLLVIAATGWLAVSSLAQGERFERDGVSVPSTSIEGPGDAGMRAHTNHLIYIPTKPAKSAAPTITTPPAGESPSSLACVYQTVAGSPLGCPTSPPYINPTGGSGVIVLVDAYDYPSAYNDLTVFSNQFGLPVLNNCTGTTLKSSSTNCFQVVYASGRRPQANCGWAQEASLDIEWAHAMAPHANIVLVESANNGFSSLFGAVQKAGNIAHTFASAGLPAEVSMSWGGSEFFYESLYDQYFNSTGVAYFAAAGDSGGRTIYPAVSPNVIAAGGTTVNRSGGSFTGEAAWSGGGGGPSAYESLPSYQSGVSYLGTPLSSRGTPDFSFDADPNSGVAVYDSTYCQGYVGWLVFGGTSVAAPSLAGIVNLANHKLGTGASSSNAEQLYIYQTYGSASYSSDYRDITSGSNGYNATPGWDFATGVGSNLGLLGK